MAKFEPLSKGHPHSPDINHCIFQFRPEGQWEPPNEVGSLRLAKHLIGLEPGTFRFYHNGEA